MDRSSLLMVESKQVFTKIPQEIARREGAEKATFLNELEAKVARTGFNELSVNRSTSHV